MCVYVCMYVCMCMCVCMYIYRASNTSNIFSVMDLLTNRMCRIYISTCDGKVVSKHIRIFSSAYLSKCWLIVSFVVKYLLLYIFVNLFHKGCDYFDLRPS